MRLLSAELRGNEELLAQYHSILDAEKEERQLRYSVEELMKEPAGTRPGGELDRDRVCAGPRQAEGTLGADLAELSEREAILARVSTVFSGIMPKEGERIQASLR